MKPKVIAVVGPTSSGKTSLGIYLAKKLGGEIISADSRQVYRGLDIGTGKVTKKEMQGVPHHLLDVANPKKPWPGGQFSADDFVRRGTQAIRGMIYHTSPVIPIVVGGTGFYIDTLLGRMNIPPVPPNPALRARLEKKSVAQLFAMLKKIDPRRERSIEPRHKRRLIRAIEIAQGGNPKAERRTWAVEAEGEAEGLPPEAKYEILWLGLNPGAKKLKENIHKRLVACMKSGMIVEAKKLRRAGLSYKRMEELGLEYRYLALYLQGKLTRAQMLEQLERAINKYAKRQMRWFKRNKDIRWVAGKTEALTLAKKFISR